MDITVQFRGDNVVIALAGQFGLDGADQLRAVVRRNLPEGAEALFLDLSGLAFIDSIGLGTLLGLRKTLAEDGTRLVLVSPSDASLETIRRMKLDAIFEIAPAADL